MNDSSYPTEADLDLIQRVIPHRFPFLMIDRIRDIVPGQSCIGIKCVTVNEPQFQGHFPGMPIFPGVLVVEALAQTAGALVGITLGLADKNPVFYFMGIDGARFRRKVVPGDVLELHVKAVRGGGRVWRFEGRAMVAGELAAEAVVTAMLDLPGGRGRVRT